MTFKITMSILLITLTGTAKADQNHTATLPIDTQSTAFVLSVEANGPGIDLLNSGDLDAAISIARKTAQHSQALSAHLIMCAAHIRNASTEQAQIVCDRAIELAKLPITTSRNPHGHKNREGLAMAYSNRAILRSISGNHDGATADFALALQQKRSTNVIMHNKRIHETLVQVAHDRAEQ